MKRVFTYGAFDLLHPGHIRLLEKAKALGDMLHVGIVSDKAVAKLKGPGRPIQPQRDRMEIVKALKCVHRVYEMNSYDPVPLLAILNRSLGSMTGNQGLQVLCKGDDWERIPGSEWARLEGIEAVRLPYSDGFSTSKTIERIVRGASGMRIVTMPKDYNPDDINRLIEESDKWTMHNL